MNVSKIIVLAPMYGDEIKIGQAFFISIFAMLVVFLVLLAISYLIDITAYLLKKEASAQAPTKKVAATNVTTTIDNGAVVAAIAAAVASYMGTSVDNIIVKKIKRVGSFGSMWAKNGTLKQIN